MIPHHIAIIPDGNRRWAKAWRLNPWEGHQEGVKRFWEIADAAHRAGINHATFWAGSYDNFNKRTKTEVAVLLELMRDELANPSFREKIMSDEVRFRVIGEWKNFIKDQSTIESIELLESESKKFTEKSLTILFAYDGQREVLAAINSLSGEVTSEDLRKALWTGELPDVDLVIRTGGEPHWSAGFMMWLVANSELYFTGVLWPDFTESELKKAITEYSYRERRLGK